MVPEDSWRLGPEPNPTGRRLFREVEEDVRRKVSSQQSFPRWKCQRHAGEMLGDSSVQKRVH